MAPFTVTGELAYTGGTTTPDDDGTEEETVLPEPPL